MPGVNPANYPRLYWDLRPTVNGRGANRHNLANFIELTGWIQYQIDNEFIEIAGIIYAENGLHLKSVDTANEDDATTVHLGGTLIEDTTITYTDYNLIITGTNDNPLGTLTSLWGGKSFLYNAPYYKLSGNYGGLSTGKRLGFSAYQEGFEFDVQIKARRQPYRKTFLKLLGDYWILGGSNFYGDPFSISEPDPIIAGKSGSAQEGTTGGIEFHFGGSTPDNRTTFDWYSFPIKWGSNNQVLVTEANGILKWDDVSNLIDTGLINAESGLHIKESHTGDPNDADTVHLGGKLLEDTFIDLIEIDYDTPRDLEISGLGGATTQRGPSDPYQTSLLKHFTKWEWENKVDDPMIDYLFLWNDENELIPGLNNRFYATTSFHPTDPGDIFITNDEASTAFSKNDINFTRALLGSYATDRDLSNFGGDRLFSHAEFSTINKGVRAKANLNKPEAFISTGSRILPIGVEPNINNDWAFKNEIYLDDSGISFRFTNTGAPGNFPSPNGSYLFPTSDGTENQVLTTDGSGVLRWEDPCCTDLLVDADYLCLNAWLGVEGKGPPLDTGSTISEVFEAVFELLCDALLNIETLQNQVETLQEEVDTLQCFHTNINIQGVIVNDDSDPGATGSIDLNVTNGEAPYTYSWTSIPAGFTATTKNIRNLSPITYIVEVTDNNGCQETAQFDVLQEAAPADPTLQLFTSCVNFTRDWEGNINTGILTNINPNIVMTDYDIQFITEGIMLGSSPTEMATCGFPWSDDPLWATNYNNQAGSPSFGAITANPTDTYGSLNFGGVASCDYDDVYASAVTVVITINGNYLSPASPIVNKTFVGVIPAHSFGQQGTLPPDQAVCVDFYESVIV